MGSAPLPANPLFLFSSSVHKLPTNLQSQKPISKICVISASSSGGSKLMSELAVSTAERTGFGFKNLTETFWVDIQRAEGRPLSVPLINPLTIANSRLDKLENVAIRLELSNGCVGWGEATVLPHGTDQAMALVKAREACQFLRESPPMTLNLVFDEIGGILSGPEFASVRTGIEMALIDAVANSIDVPLWRLFGGVSNSLLSAVTISSAYPAEAFELASKYSKLRSITFKLNIGKDLSADIDVFQAIRTAHPHCLFIFDANEEYTSEEAIEVLEKLHNEGLAPILFEQPVYRDDWKGLAEVISVARDKYNVPVAADESCRSLVDIQKIVKEDLADVINIKLSNFGVLGTLTIVEIVRQSELNLMIDGLLETRLATGFAGHLAAGLGCFKYINLNTPTLLLGDPVVQGYEVSGGHCKFLNTRGQGCFLNWEFISWAIDATL